MASGASGGAGAAPAGASRPDIFISYAWATQKKAHSVAQALREAGFLVWLDNNDMAATCAEGRGTGDAMRLGVSRSAAVVICMSATYAVRPNCRLEAEYADECAKDVFWVK